MALLTGAAFVPLACSSSDKILSLELFNRSYRDQDELSVAKTGLEKRKGPVREIPS